MTFEKIPQWTQAAACEQATRLPQGPSRYRAPAPQPFLQACQGIGIHIDTHSLKTKLCRSVLLAVVTVLHKQIEV